MSSLTGRKPKDTYPWLLQAGAGGPLSGTPRPICLGDGTPTPLSITSTGLQVGGTEVGIPRPVVPKDALAVTFELADKDRYVRMETVTEYSVTIPPQADVAWPANTELVLRTSPTGLGSVVGGTGVTIHRGQTYAAPSATIRLKRISENEWDEESPYLLSGYGLSPLAASYLAALLAAGVTPEPASIIRLSKALVILETAGILSNLVDGGYYGTDAQKATGAPLSFRGVAASTFTGTFTRDGYGLVFPATGSANIRHTVTGLRTGTLLVDGSSAHDAAAYSGFAEVASADLANVAMFGSNNGGTGALFAKNAGAYTISGNTANGVGSRMTWMRNRDRNTVAMAFGGGSASACWVDGMLSTPTTPPTYSTAVDLTAVSFGSTFQLRGRIHSWLLFDKRLSDAEVIAATVAIGMLDRRPINLLVEGDSTSESIYSLSYYRDHWPDKILAVSGFDSAVRIGVHAASSGHLASSMAGQWATEVGRNYVGGKLNLYCCWAGVNDLMAGASAATVYASLLAATNTARAAGCLAMIPTLAVPDWSISNPTWFAAANSLNGLIRAGLTNGDFELSADIDAAIPNHTGANAALWRDAIHLNGDGNAIVAGLIAAAMPT
jgi:hypothetical protein